MSLRRYQTLAALILAACSVGCTAPVVTITHHFGSAVPIPPHADLRPGVFTLNCPDPLDLSDFIRQTLTDCAVRRPAASTHEPVAPPSPTLAVTVSGTIDVDINEESGSRPVRRRDRETGQLTSVRVPFLVRQISLDADIVVTPADNAPAVTVEIRRSYDSRQDPRVRGDLGLARADNPDTVPASAIVIRELLAECLWDFCDMLQPIDFTVEAALRPSLDGMARAGLKAADKHNLTTAAARFADAHRRRPKDADILYNLAVTTEAIGRLDAAAAHYADVLKLKKQKDPQAKAALTRVRRVTARRKQLTRRPH